MRLLFYSLSLELVLDLLQYLGFGHDLNRGHCETFYPYFKPIVACWCKCGIRERLTVQRNRTCFYPDHGMDTRPKNVDRAPEEAGASGRKWTLLSLAAIALLVCGSILALQSGGPGGASEKQEPAADVLTIEGPLSPNIEPEESPDPDLTTQESSVKPADTSSQAPAGKTSLSKILDLRGRFVKPELTTAGMTRRLTEGRVVDAFPLTDEHIIVVTYGGAQLVDMVSQEVLWEIDCPASSALLSLEAGRLALISGDVNIWDLYSGDRVSEHPASSFQRTLDLSPTGDRLVTLGENECPSIRNVRQRTSDPLEPEGPEGPDRSGPCDGTRDLKFAPDGIHLAAETAEGIKLLDTRDWSQVASLDIPGSAQDMQFHAERNILVAAGYRFKKNADGRKPRTKEKSNDLSTLETWIEVIDLRTNWTIAAASLDDVGVEGKGVSI